jgi:hypothetical protein
MPYVKGQSGNPKGGNVEAREALRKIRKSFSMAIDRLKSGNSLGMDALANMLCKSMQDDLLNTLRAASSYMPKDIQVESEGYESVDKLTDAQVEGMLTEYLAKTSADKPEITDKPEGTVSH